MSFTKTADALIFKKGNETVRIESWGKNALRVRSSLERDFTGNDWGLTEALDSAQKGKAVISIDEKEGASITNGKICAKVNPNGIIGFYKDGALVRHEYFRSYDPSASRESVCLKVINREFNGIRGGD